MRSRLILLILLFLFGCAEKKKAARPPLPIVVVKHSDDVVMDTNVNYVKRYFIKNGLAYPVNADTCDTCLKIEYYVSSIVKNKGNTALRAFEEISGQLEIDSNVAYWLCCARVFRDSGKVYYSIAIQKYKNNLSKTTGDAMDEGFVDSNRIRVSANRALFVYKNNKLTFAGWYD